MPLIIPESGNWNANYSVQGTAVAQAQGGVVRVSTAGGPDDAGIELKAGDAITVTGMTIYAKAVTLGAALSVEEVG